MPSDRSRIFLRAFAALACLVLIVLIRTALLSKGSDFEIFWKTGQRLVQLQPIYVPEIDGGRCFKYPPWAAPFFAPLALFNRTMGEMIWRLALVSCLSWSTFKLLSQRNERGQIGVLVAFIGMIGIWNCNIEAGQLTPALIALALLPFVSGDAPTLVRASAMLIGLSSKIFPLMTAAALGRTLRRPSVWATTFATAVLLTVPAILATPGKSFSRLFHDFLASASSSGAVLGGSMNGLPALFSSVLGVERDQMIRQSGLSLISVAIALALWFSTRRYLESRLERAALALALSVSVTPLAYTYGLGLAYPWFALQMARSSDNRFQSATDWAMLFAFAWMISPLPYRALTPLASVATLAWKERST